MTRIKICGIRRLEDALAAIEFGADALGFNFYPRSPRYISVRQASRLIAALPPFITKVGVVVDFGAARDIVRLKEAVGLDAIQLHGEESAELARRLLPWPVIKAFRVGEDFDFRTVRSFPANAILLDGFSAGKPGGTGKTFDWKMARQAGRDRRIIVSGGLTASNVAEAIAQARPYAVDVASGVESSEGKKDFRKMRQFIAAVKRME
ncbi:MAG: phosphoribosylanthranilate isomerase [Acidobacteriia bacterium]|nr:phosphoribosylanthranilate isomerase [Terriglobia bacterium]